MAGAGPGKSRGERGAEMRAARSRAALRENLKRRKAQARERRGEAEPEAAAPSHDSAGFVPHKPKG